MKETVLIVLPLPHAVLSPNKHTASRRGARWKACEIAKYRAKAKEVAESALVETAPWKLASIQATFYHGCIRRRDQDNAVASLKAAYDGITDSGLIVDDDFAHLHREMPTFEIDKKQPRVELLLTREDSNV